jgi:peptidoglycan hydrolase CwlO-like protein
MTISKLKTFVSTNYVGIIMLVLALLSIIGLIVFSVKSNVSSSTQKDENNYKELLKEVKVLNSKVDSIELKRDTLYKVINSSKTKIKYIDKWYEKNYIDITNQPVTNDVEFFKNYISEANK